MPRAYLDTSVISALAEQDRPRSEQEAINGLMDLVEDSGLAVCTSTEAKGELRQIGDEDRRDRHMGEYDTVQTLQREADLLDPDEPFTDEAPDTLERLQSVLPDETNACRIAHAAMHRVEDFVTTERRTILSRASEVEQASGVSVWSPSEYLTAIAESG